MIGISIANSLGFTGPSVLPDASSQAYFAATGITGVTQQTAINNLVKGLKADGIWSKMKAVYPFVTDNRNLLGYTEDFSNTAWGKVQNATVTTNTFTAPNGTLTADTITGTINSTNPTTSNGSKVFYHSGNNATIQAQNNTLTGSIYVYATTAITIQLFMYEWGGAEFGQSYTLSANTWQRISITSTFSGGTGNVGLAIQSNANTLYAWGAQLELGSTATTYQPIATTQQAYIASQFKYNLKDPRDLDAAFRLVFNGGWTHSSTGATPNGTNGYADTFYNPSASGQLNSAHVSYYSRTNSNGTEVEIGVERPITNFQLLEIRTAGLTYFYMNQGGGLGIADANSLGYYIGNRTASNVVNGFKNGTKINNASTSSILLPNAKIYLAAYNQSNNTAAAFSTKQSAFATIGDGLTDTDASNLYTRVQAYQTALSRQV
jgi:hypothetical protein